jgi:hypothetical protein
MIITRVGLQAQRTVSIGHAGDGDPGECSLEGRGRRLGPREEAAHAELRDGIQARRVIRSIVSRGLKETTKDSRKRGSGLVMSQGSG